MNLSAVVLVGGESRRMGRDKAWVELDGKPLIVRAVDTARKLGIEEVFISGRVGEDYSALKCPVLFDRELGFGPLGGIERGLHAATSTLLLVLAVDLPHMTTEFLKKLFASCDRFTGVVPELDGRLEPLAAIYPKRCHAFVFEAIAESRRAARDFAAVCLHARTVRTVPVSADDAGCFANWNAPADLTFGGGA
jgi:molybdenum cofactor guanylyltransferase